MVQIIKRKIVRRPKGRGWAQYDAQEPGDKPPPEIRRPPDSELPDTPPEGAKFPGAPPFTGEDVEHRKPDVPPPM